jgi:hypothetical protein
MLTLAQISQKHAILFNIFSHQWVDATDSQLSHFSNKYLIISCWSHFAIAEYLFCCVYCHCQQCCPDTDNQENMWFLISSDQLKEQDGSNGLELLSSSFNCSLINNLGLNSGFWVGKFSSFHWQSTQCGMKYLMASLCLQLEVHGYGQITINQNMHIPYKHKLRWDKEAVRKA